LLEPLDLIEIVGEARDGLEAVDVIVKLKPALVFLDVQMPGLSGFEVLGSLPSDSWPLVIFATAFDQYALDAFDANAVGYLLKPVNRDKLNVAVERAAMLMDRPKELAAERSRIVAVEKSVRDELKHVVARTRDRFVLLPLNEICFFRVEDGIVKAKSISSLLRTDYSIGDLDTRLPDPPFFRAHRSVIVNATMIAEIAPLMKGSYQLTMKDEQRSELQVSERQSKAVRELLQR
jgi:DNA-binding LytR/AlgR family response regulator